MILPKKINKVFPDITTNNGIFKALENIGVPWSEDIDGATLDIEYMYNISGQKNISPLVNKILGNSPTLSAENITALANIIYKMFARNWTKLYNTMLLEYNPISNYDMTETENTSGTDTGTRENTGTVGNTRTDTQTTADTQTAQGTGTGATDNNIYGFNSADAVGDTNVETSNTTNTTATGQTTRSDHLTDTRTDNLSEETSGSHESERTLTRSGNIGVTTSQQMIESERNLWLWNFIYNVVFPDVNKILCTQTYTNF